MSREKRIGFSIVELIVVLAMAAIVVSLSLPLLQTMRAAARRTTCLDNLATIGMASIEFDEINGSLPPFMGVPGQNASINEVSSRLVDFQLTYSHVQLLSVLGFEDLADEIDPFAFSSKNQTLVENGYGDFLAWFQGVGLNNVELPGIEPLVFGQNLPTLRCPDDTLDFSDIIVGLHPTQDLSISSGIFIARGKTDPSITNYAANGGGLGATRLSTVREFAGFHGPIRSREADSIATIPDGASNVVMFGEALGVIDFNSQARHSLAGGLAFGRVTVYGIENIFGDANESNAIQFGSFHTESVNIVRCDGSTMIVNRNVDDEMFGRFCGSADGFPVQLFVLGDVNQDNVLDLLDVQPFVDAILNQNFQIEADINRDGEVDLMDVQPFVELLTE